MEKELYHAHLTELKKQFGEATVMIPLSKAAGYLHMDPRTLEADKTFPIKILNAKGKRVSKNVPLINFARWLA